MGFYTIVLTIVFDQIPDMHEYCVKKKFVMGNLSLSKPDSIYYFAAHPHRPLLWVDYLDWIT